MEKLRRGGGGEAGSRKDKWHVVACNAITVEKQERWRWRSRKDGM